MIDSTQAVAYHPTIDDEQKEWRSKNMVGLNEAERRAVDAALQREKSPGSSLDKHGGISKAAQKGSGIRSRPAPRASSSPSAESAPRDESGSSDHWCHADKDNEPMDDGE